MDSIGPTDLQDDSVQQGLLLPTKPIIDVFAFFGKDEIPGKFSDDQIGRIILPACHLFDNCFGQHFYCIHADLCAILQ